MLVALTERSPVSGVIVVGERVAGAHGHRPAQAQAVGVPGMRQITVVGSGEAAALRELAVGEVGGAHAIQTEARGSRVVTEGEVSCTPSVTDG